MRRRLKTAQNRRKILAFKEQKSAVNVYEDMDSSPLVNINKGTMKSVYSKENIKLMHQQYQLKRLGPNKIKRLVQSGKHKIIERHANLTRNVTNRSEFMIIKDSSGSNLLKSPISGANTTFMNFLNAHNQTFSSKM
jgi:hypothetical protein